MAGWGDGRPCHPAVSRSRMKLRVTQERHGNMLLLLRKERVAPPEPPCKVVEALMTQERRERTRVEPPCATDPDAAVPRGVAVLHREHVLPLVDAVIAVEPRCKHAGLRCLPVEDEAGLPRGYDEGLDDMAALTLLLFA